MSEATPQAVEIDPKRTVAAVPRTVFQLDGSAPDGLDMPPGTCQVREPYRGEPARRLMFACPGCGMWGSIRCADRVGDPKPTPAPSWEVVKGDLDDPATLSLAPSIHCVGCCNWHGYLTDGVFQSC